MVVYNGVPVYITTLVVIAMAFGILTGVSKGYKRSIVKMLSTLAAAVLAFIVAMFVAKSFAGEAFLEKFMTSMELQGIYTEISDVSDSIVEIIQSIPAAIIPQVISAPTKAFIQLGKYAFIGLVTVVPKSAFGIKG